jgi:transposase-like protein
VIMVLDVDRAARDLAAGVLACPRCAGRLRPWSWAPARRVRQLDGSYLAVRPRRARCAACRATHVLLPASCLPRCGDATAVIGAVLAAKAVGRGHRGIARDLDRPAATVRRWLRRARGQHPQWLRRQGVEHTRQLAPDLLAGLVAQPTELADALQALAAAVVAFRRRFEQHAETWTLIGVLTRGRLLASAPFD